MTTHLFHGRTETDHDVVTSQITVCCRTHVFGLPSGDQGTLDPAAADCPGDRSPAGAEMREREDVERPNYEDDWDREPSDRQSS